MKLIDQTLNKITMYRLMLYYMIALVLIASFFGYFELIPYSGLYIFSGAIIAVTVCFVSNLLLSKLFHTTTNVESALITALIIVLIFPVAAPSQSLALIAVCIISVASKYILVYRKKHIFNPAAVAVFIFALFYPNFTATWWVGSSIMVLPVVIGGFFLSRRIQRGHMIVFFLFVYFVLTSVSSVIHNPSIDNLWLIWKSSAVSSALFFFAFVMLTEPLTSPVTEKFRTIYSVVVGVLYATPILGLPVLAITPETALLAGNIFSFIVNPKYRLVLPLLEKIKLTQDIYLLKFEKKGEVKFTPGQYMEWTLPHAHTDSRGNRRYFSIASAPHENTLMLTVRKYTPGSSFKEKLLSMEKGMHISASSLSGDFTMPKNSKTPLVFVAGGVGVAPFRSMLEDIIYQKRMVDIIVLFFNKRQEDIIFSKTFEDAKKFGVTTHYIITKETEKKSSFKGYTQQVSENFIKDTIKDYGKRIYFISGPRMMVEDFEDILKKIGVKGKNIKVDFFPGYTDT